MRATYQSNFKKINQYIEKPIPRYMHFDPKEYVNHEPKLVHEFLRYSLDPWKESYSSPLTHINLYEVSDIKKISTLPSLLVRDGLFTLLDFFYRCPSPKDISGILTVHNCLRDFIPDKWRSKVLFYEFEYRANNSNVFHQKNDEILIKANVTNGMFNYEESFKTIIGLKKLGYKKFNLFLFFRSNQFLASEWDNDYRINEYVFSQAKFISALEKEKLKVELHTWKEFFNTQGMHQFDCLDLNHKEKYYVDDFSNYTFFKKGCTPINVISQKGDPADTYIPLSHFHGIRLLSREPNHNSKIANEIFKTLSLLKEDKEKYDTDIFQAIDSMSGKKLDSAWVKSFR